MSDQCRAPGCGARTGRYGAFCPSHAARKRRHGEHDQRGLRLADLKPHLKRVRARVLKNDRSLLWGNVEKRWLAVAENAKEVVARFESGRAGVAWELIAAREVLRVAATVEPRRVVEVVLAIYLLADSDPNFFRSDAAFRTQLVRVTRRLCAGNSRAWTNAATGETKRAHSELSPRAVSYFAAWLIEAVGVVGVHLAHLERKEAEGKAQERQEFGRLLTELE